MGQHRWSEAIRARCLRGEVAEVAVMIREATASRIVHNMRILGGEPTIRGTRVPVRSVVLLYREYDDVEAVQRALPTADVPSILAALEYYALNREEIERYIAENEDQEAGVGA